MKRRTKDPRIPADRCGRPVPAFSVDLVVRGIPHSVAFYQGVLGATVPHCDPDFVAREVGCAEIRRFLAEVAPAFGGR